MKTKNCKGSRREIQKHDNFRKAETIIKKKVITTQASLKIHQLQGHSAFHCALKKIVPL